MQEQAALQFRREIEDEAHFLSTCDGGDPGTPEDPSIWLFGIEPGWTFSDQQSDEAWTPEAAARLAAYSVDLQLEWNYNRKAFQLLAALEGLSPRDYLYFARRAQPFVANSKGYLKGNLFPVPFNKVTVWDEGAILMTGFETKQEYRSWVRSARFPVLKAWMERCRPRLVIGCGITHVAEYLEIAGADQPPREFQFEVNGHIKRVFISTGGIAPVAIVPHLSRGIYSLNSYESIARTAEIIRAEI